MTVNKFSKPLMLSALVIVLGLAALAAGLGLRFHAHVKDTVDFIQLYICMAAAVVIAFVFGALRHSLGAGVALGLVALHDQLLTLALVSLLSILLPQSQSLPVLQVLAVAFTFCQSLPVLKAAIALRAATPLRDMDNDQVAQQAVRAGCLARRLAAGLALLMFIAGAVSGKGLLAGFLAPVPAALIASAFSARFLTPGLWAVCAARWGMKKTSR